MMGFFELLLLLDILDSYFCKQKINIKIHIIQLSLVEFHIVKLHHCHHITNRKH